MPRKRYKYNMHHQWITESRIGLLKPFMIQEVTPGDIWGGRCTGIFRMSPLDIPTYMSLNIYAHIYYVPHSQTFEEFPEVYTGKDTTTPWPTQAYAIANHAYWNKFGLGVTSQTPDLNSMPVMAYNHIINNFFLDQNKYSDRTLTDFTDFRVNFPPQSYHGGIQDEIQQGTEETINTGGATLGITNVTDAIRRQRIKQRRERYGEKYSDALMADFGERLPEYAQDRPIHCARAQTTMGISEVVATATSTSENTGEYRGHGITGMTLKMKRRKFSEPGILMGVMYARPRLVLHDKHDKIWNINDVSELYYPDLDNSRPVIVRGNEVYAAEAVDSDFGYQSKYEWLRTGVDTVAGKMQEVANKQWSAHVDIGALPTVTYLQQVQDYDFIFQDQTATRVDLNILFDNKVTKSSKIRPRGTGI